jgi:hypothetical protein
MATLRATSFYSGTATGGGPVTLYTVPSGHKIILRSVNLYNEEGSNSAVTIAVPGFPTICAIVLAAAGSFGANFNIQPHITFDAGTVIAFYGQSGHTISVILSGTLLFV